MNFRNQIFRDWMFSFPFRVFMNWNERAFTFALCAGIISWTTWRDSSVGSVVSNCSILLGSVACWSWQLCIDDTNGIKFPKKVPYFFSSWNPWIPDFVFFFHFRFTAYVDTPLKFFSRLANIESEIFILLFASFLHFVDYLSIMNSIFSIFNVCNTSFVLYVSLSKIMLTPLLRNVVKWSYTLPKSCSKCCKIFKVCLTIFWIGWISWWFDFLILLVSKFVVILVKRKSCISVANSQKQPPEVFCKKGALRNFTKFTGKQLC